LCGRILRNSTRADRAVRRRKRDEPHPASKCNIFEPRTRRNPPRWSNHEGGTRSVAWQPPAEDAASRRGVRSGRERVGQCELADPSDERTERRTPREAHTRCGCSQPDRSWRQGCDEPVERWVWVWSFTCSVPFRCLQCPSGWCSGCVGGNPRGGPTTWFAGTSRARENGRGGCPSSFFQTLRGHARRESLRSSLETGNGQGQPRRPTTR
jgi:hypothetical protein